MAEVRLYSNGVEYRGFKGATITKSITSLVGTFLLTITEKKISDNRFYLMSPGDPAEVRVIHDNGTEETLITGYIDQRNLSLTKAGRQITVSGRDKASDLIDCSCEIENSNEQIGRSFLELAQVLSKPYGIVFTQSTNKEMKVKSLSIEPGKSVFEVLEEQARTFGVLLISTGTGVVDIAEPGKTRSSVQLEEGKNITSISTKIDVSSLYTNYRVIGQSDSDDELNLESATELEGTSSDSLLSRPRNLTVIVEKNATQEDVQNRAEWEATTRRARARKVEVKTPTWFQLPGLLWKHNQLIPVISPSSYVGIDNGSKLLMSEQVTYVLDEKISTTTLQLISRNSFIPEPSIPPEEDGVFL